MQGHFVRLTGKDKFTRKMAERFGVTIPFEGFTCDGGDERG